MELMSIGKFAKKVRVSTSTLRNMDKENIFKPCKVSECGTRYYLTEQLREFQNVNDNKTKIAVGYCRVSTPSQKDDIETQVSNLKTYMFDRRGEK